MPKGGEHLRDWLRPWMPRFLGILYTATTAAGEPADLEHLTDQLLDEYAHRLPPGDPDLFAGLAAAVRNTLSDLVDHGLAVFRATTPAGRLPAGYAGCLRPAPPSDLDRCRIRILWCKRSDMSARRGDVERITGHAQCRRHVVAERFVRCDLDRHLAQGENIERGLYQSCTDPSRRRLTGRYFGSYGYRAAASSSNVTPRPGWSPGCM
jgi:hypothetical protein